MSTLEIKTNRQPRELLSWFDLTKKEQEQFDYIEEPEELGYEFFRYKGHCYSLEEFMRTGKDHPFGIAGYDGYSSDSYFSGVLIKFSDCGDAVYPASYYS